MTKNIPIAPIKRILKSTHMRVSDDAAAELEKILATFAKDIADDAAKMATHAGRKTITAKDIELAIQ
jgi:histone H3/H4